MSQQRVFDILREKPGVALRAYAKNLDSKVYYVKPVPTSDFPVFEPGSFKQSMCDFLVAAHYILLEEHVKLGSGGGDLAYSLTHELSTTLTEDSVGQKVKYPLGLPVQLQRTQGSREVSTLKIAEGLLAVASPGNPRAPSPTQCNNLKWLLMMRAQHGFYRPLLKIENVRQSVLQTGLTEDDVNLVLANARMAKGIRLPEEYHGDIPGFVPYLGDALERIVFVFQPNSNTTFLHQFKDVKDMDRDIEELRCATDCVILEQFYLLDSLPPLSGLLLASKVDVTVGSPDGPTQPLKMMPIFIDKSPNGILNARLAMAYQLFALGFEHNFPQTNIIPGIPNTTQPQIITRRIKSLTLDMSPTTLESAIEEHGLVHAGPGTFAPCHEDICGSNCPHTVYKAYVLARLERVNKIIIAKSTRLT